MRFFVSSVVATVLATTTFAFGDEQKSVDFAREIRPILARKCFACHGPNANESGLRLHEQEGAFAKLDSGESAVVPGQPDASELIRRVTSEDHDVRMPPEGKPLTSTEVTLVRRWIEQGGEYTPHWAFRPIASPEPWRPAEEKWIRGPIDGFVLKELREKGLAPNPPAEPRELLRRVAFDLTGLPPTLDESESFVTAYAKDPDAAYAAAVDRLLDSPHYGEKWARHWLDVVRFAETNSFERDGLKPHAWRYRDYVIRSFNDDKPYDQFVFEQLAGDELIAAGRAKSDAEALIATGFYRLGLWDDEPADRDLALFDGYDDLATTIGQGMLGLTFNCARCHDHKIDPIPQRDYYGLVAFVRGVTPNGYENPNVSRPVIDGPEAKKRYEQATAAHKARQDDLHRGIDAIEEDFRKRAAKIAPTTADDLEGLESRFYRDTWDVLPKFDDLKPETIAKPERQLFDIRTASRDDAFGFVFVAQLKVPVDGKYRFTVDSDDGSRLVLDGKEVLRYDGIHGVGDPKSIELELKAGRTPIRLDYFQRHGGKGLAVQWSGPDFAARFLTATTADNQDVAASDAALAAVLGEKKNQRPIRELVDQFGAQTLGAEVFKRYRDLRHELEETYRVRPWDEHALCVTEHGPVAPETFILRRGSPQNPGDKVEPIFPTALGGGSPTIERTVPDAPTSFRRTALAQWITSPENPLTARVIVNRVWQHHFGRGIVRSPNNFGQMGDPPTHPELLDWLAGELVRGGWRLKPLHRQIVLSSVYRQSSRSREDGQRLDANNDLFWRFNPRRLAAEEIRDATLAVAGTLNDKMYGPGVFPKISAEVLAGQSVPGNGWKESPPEERSRRSIYIHVKRSLIVPEMAVFDFPDTDGTCEARFNTTQPAQALNLLNGAFQNEQAELLAKRVRAEAPNNLKRQIARTIELALGRRATEAEIARGERLIETLKTKHKLADEPAFNHWCLLTINTNEFLFVD